MRNSLDIGEVSFIAAPPHLRARGLCGWITAVVDGFCLTGIALRRTIGGTYALSLPGRLDAYGRRRPYALLVDAAAREEMKRQLLTALREQGWIEP